jgi:hypothetical protein
LAYALVVAGLNTPAYDRIKKESNKRLAPNGTLIVTPHLGGATYSEDYIEDLLQKTYEVAKNLNESTPFSTLLLYADFENKSTENLLDRFFPFSLPLGFKPLALDLEISKKEKSEKLNLLAAELIESAKILRNQSKIICDITAVGNLSPLLLPLRNFKSDFLPKMIGKLYKTMAKSEDAASEIKQAVKSFFTVCPKTYAEEAKRHCFSDGILYFQSPGKARHGFFRNGTTEAHDRSCLLNARSRIGGAYDYRFHYDCIPTKGSLKKSYPDCHGAGAAPKTTHVNIAPNDYIV